MKKSLLIGIIIILTLSSCQNRISNPNEFLFKADNGLAFKYSDFELYDSSTHILYLKNNHPVFKDEQKSYFSVMANGEEIYKGVFLPSYSNSLPYGPYIYTAPSLYPDYTIKIEHLTIDNLPKDPRNDPRIISALKEHNLLHSGLSVSINSIDINGTQLTFIFTVTNQDRTNLLILDLDKTGPNLFHYFTNGLSIRKLTYEKVFSSNIQVQTPTPWNIWKPEWLSELKSGDSRQFTINYTLESLINPGEYIAMFGFSGFTFQVTKDQLYQDNKRIWLGYIQTTKKITLP